MPYSMRHNRDRCHGTRLPGSKPSAMMRIAASSPASQWALVARLQGVPAGSPGQSWNDLRAA
jgi:hypothetical protein